jgi:hypothetical protein
MGHKFNTPSTELYIILKTLFPPAERLWALKPDFHCGGRKKREFALFSFAFFALFFLCAFALFFWLRARERKSAKKAPAPTSAHQELDSTRI